MQCTAPTYRVHIRPQVTASTGVLTHRLSAPVWEAVKADSSDIDLSHVASLVGMSVMSRQDMTGKPNDVSRVLDGQASAPCLSWTLRDDRCFEFWRTGRDELR